MALYGCVLVRVFNVKGEVVAESDNGFLPAGEYSLRFSLRDQPPGIYFFQIMTMESIETRMFRPPY